MGQAGSRPTEKNAGRVAYFNPLARLGPPRITRGPSAGRGGLACITYNLHNFKMYTFFYTPIFSSCSLIFYILKFLITSYYACFMKIIL